MSQIDSDDVLIPRGDEIDLRELINSILRKKVYLIAVSSLSVVLGAFYAFTIKPTWEGHFQIVLRGENSNQNISSSIGNLSALSSMIGLTLGSGTGSNNDLQTEVKILESSSILMPIYDFVKTKKLESGQDISKVSFLKWKKANLDIDLELGTRVLNLAYRDTDKSLIIPVMKRISKEYQQYSGSDREKGITKGLLFLEKQIEVMKDRSRKSLMKLQSFSLENGLGNRDGLPMPSNKNSNMSTYASAPNQILDLNEKNINNMTEKLNIKFEEKSYGDMENENRYAQQYADLARLEAQMLEQSLTFKPNSKKMIFLKNKIARLKSSLSRTPEILLKYRELQQNAQRDEKVLLTLQSSKTSLLLQKARQSNPWVIISEPTLLDQKVAPRKSVLLSLSLFIGISLGSLLALLVDKKSGQIYSFKFLKNKIKYPLLKTLLIPSKNWFNSISLLSNVLKDGNSNTTIAIIPVGEAFNQNYINLLSDSLMKEIGKSNILVSNDLNKTSKCSKQLLVLSPGSCTNFDLNQIQEDLLIQKGSVAGWIFVYP